MNGTVEFIHSRLAMMICVLLHRQTWSAAAPNAELVLLSMLSMKVRLQVGRMESCCIVLTDDDSI